jgi:D-lactate dehydrogenase (cytochrome)
MQKQFLDKLTQIVGARSIITEPTDMASYLHEERGLAQGTADAVLRPSKVQEVAKILKACTEAKIPVVPVGGSTGLVGGTVASGGVIIATDKLNKIIKVDPLNKTMVVETGCILADIQTAASENNCLFPLSLGAEGSCQIGGNLSTNAGGIGVLRYGNTRDLVLGLEVVLPNGEIWDGLNSLRKDNTGYDLKHLFIGAEGTLGVITKAVLKLFPAPKTSTTVFVAFPKIGYVLELFNQVQNICGDLLTAYELVPRFALELGLAHIPGIIDPFPATHPYYALIELTSSREKDDLRTQIENILESSHDNNIITDAVFAESDGQRKELWKIREEIPAAQKREGGSIKHDVSVSVSQTIEFINEASKRVSKILPNIRPCPFGHIGDGNIHFNLTQPRNMDVDDFLAHYAKFNRIIHDLVSEMNGSISAEHGIGLFKRKELQHYASTTKISLMISIKKALDPHNIMNPGKIITPRYK